MEFSNKIPGGKKQFIMKYIKIKFLYFLAILFFSMSLISCDKDDSKIEYGIPLIYMPQATYSYAANTCDYPVPAYSDGGESQQGNAVANYTIDKSAGEGKELINIYLGVSRSGMEAFKSYSVDLIVDNDTVMKAMQKGLFADGVLLEKNAYTIPSRITVPDGKNSASFFLTLDKAILSADNRYAGKKLILAIKIQNPSRYKINTSLATTMIIVSNWENLK